MKLSKQNAAQKNSGGEGQNPCGMWHFWQASPRRTGSILPFKGRRMPTPAAGGAGRSLSKMDAEKVASCIELIRGLGSQAIISATNDKMQNYLENVDKTFVFANPNKKSHYPSKPSSGKNLRNCVVR